MKKALLCALTLIAFLSCSEFDDSEIQERLKNHEDRISKLETLCNQMNTNISSLQTIVSALQNNDYVTNVSPITENGKAIGYVITFSKSGSITIYHGKDGKDGVDGADGKDGLNGTDGKDGLNGTDGKNGIDGTDGKDGADGKDGVTPVIGVKQDSDGVYYWTLNGDWLLDDSGNKIPAVGKDGQDGADGQDGKDGIDGTNGKDGVNGTDGKDGIDGTDGKDGQNGKDGADGKDGITPQLKIEEGYWYISYDSGNSWERLGKAVGEDGKDGENGEDGDSFFQNVDTSDDAYVILTLSDGVELLLPKYVGLSISFDVEEGAACMPSASIRVGYTLSGADSGTTVETVADAGWKSVVHKTDASSGYITVTAPEYGGSGKIVMFATASNGFTTMKALCFEEGVIAGVSDVYEVGYEESVLTVELISNLAYTVGIDASASWISLIETRASMRTDVLNFRIAENPEDSPERSAGVRLMNESGEILYRFVVIQDLQPSSDPIAFSDAKVKAALLEHYDYNSDGEISHKEAQTVTQFDFNFPADITSFDELEYFTSLKYLSGFSECMFLTSVSIPESVTEIKNAAFSGCQSLKRVDMPYGVTKIENWAFQNCASLEEIIIPDSVITIEGYAFQGCGSLSNVKLSDNLTRLESHLFFACVSLESIKIPDSVTYIDNGVFRNCTNLREIDCRFAADKRSIVIDDELITVVTAGLDTYEIPDGVKTIGEWALYNGNCLNTLIIPESVKAIKDAALYNCTNITSLYCKASEPPLLADNEVLYYVSSADIYVPVGTEELYKSAVYWKDYKDNISGYDFQSMQ